MTKKKKTNNKEGKKENNKKVSSKKNNPVKFPAKLLAPIGAFLQGNLKHLEKRKKDIESEDPFKDFSRITDNASPDIDAQEQFGHARSSAMKRAVDKKIVQTKKALTRIKLGKYGICEDCNEMIDTDRLMVYPVAILCANCRKKREK